MITTDSPLLNLLGFGPTGDLGPLTGYTNKRGRPVWYLKAPPKTPPTDWQWAMRDFFRLAAEAWTQQTPAKRADWLNAGKRARLTITGYNLFIWYMYSRDHTVIHTVERHSGIQLIDPA